MLNPNHMYLLQLCINQIVVPKNPSTQALKQAQNKLSKLRTHQQYLILLLQYLNRVQPQNITVNHRQFILLELRKKGLLAFIPDRYLWENLVHFYYQCDECHTSLILDFLVSQIRLSTHAQTDRPPQSVTQMECELFDCNLELLNIIECFLEIIFKCSEWGFTQMTKLMLVISLLNRQIFMNTQKFSKKIFEYLMKYFGRIYGIVAEQFGLFYEEWVFICGMQLFVHFGDREPVDLEEFMKRIKKHSHSQNEGSLYMQTVVNLIEGKNIQIIMHQSLPTILKNLLQAVSKPSSKQNQRKKQKQICGTAIDILNHLLIPPHSSHLTDIASPSSTQFLYSKDIAYRLLHIYSSHILTNQSPSITFDLPKTALPSKNKQLEVELEEQNHIVNSQNVSQINYKLMSFVANYHYEQICEDILNKNQLNFISVLAFMKKEDKELGCENKLLGFILETLGLFLHHSIQVTPQIVSTMLLYISQNIIKLFSITTPNQDTNPHQPILKLLYTLLQLPSVPVISKSPHSKIIVHFMNSIINQVVQVLTFDKIQQLYNYSIGVVKSDPMALSVDSFYVPLILMRQVFQHQMSIDGETEVWITFLQLTQFFQEEPTNSINFELSFIMADIAAAMILKPSCQSLQVAVTKLANHFMKNTLFSTETGIVYGQYLISCHKDRQYLSDMTDNSHYFWKNNLCADDITFYISAAYTIFHFNPSTRNQFEQKLNYFLYEHIKQLQCENRSISYRQELNTKITRRLEQILDYFENGPKNILLIDSMNKIKQLLSSEL